MEEFAQKTWMFISACIVCGLTLSGIAVLVWWIIQNAKDMKREQNQENEHNDELLRHICATNAAAADAGWGNYIEMKDKYEKLSDDFDAYKKFAEKWDANKTEQIGKLEKQPKDNGITPVSWNPFGKEFEEA